MLEQVLALGETALTLITGEGLLSGVDLLWVARREGELKLQPQSGQE